MKKFLIKLSVFLALLAVILLFLEVGFRAKRTTFKGKYLGLDKYASEIELLALGHSHSQEGLDPRLFDCRAFNMAMGFQNVYFDDYILNHFIDRMDSLKCVIIPASYYHFLNPLPDLEDLRGEDLFNTVKYHLYWEASEVKGKTIPEWNPKYNLEILNNPATSYIAMFKYYLSGEAWDKQSRDDWEQFKYYGFDNRPDVIKDTTFLNEVGMKDVRAHTGQSYELCNYPYYEDIVKVCKEHGVTVVISLFPCWKAYYANMNSMQLGVTRQAMKRLSDTYDNCYMLDYLEDSRFGSTDFHDATHLNKNGCEKLSLILNDELKELGIIRQK